MAHRLLLEISLKTLYWMKAKLIKIIFRKSNLFVFHKSLQNQWTNASHPHKPQFSRGSPFSSALTFTLTTTACECVHQLSLFTVNQKVPVTQDERVRSGGGGDVPLWVSGNEILMLLLLVETQSVVVILNHQQKHSPFSGKWIKL